MDATHFVPREYHAGLKAIGRADWLIIGENVRSASGASCTLMSIRWSVLEAVLRGIPFEDRKYLLHWIESIKNIGDGMVELRALSHFLSDGPKVFRPTQKQCEAMMNVSVDITVPDYQQPHQAIAVE